MWGKAALEVSWRSLAKRPSDQCRTMGSFIRETVSRPRSRVHWDPLGSTVFADKFAAVSRMEFPLLSSGEKLAGLSRLPTLPPPRTGGACF